MRGGALVLARTVWGAVALFCIAYYIFWAIYTPSQPLPVCTAPTSACNPIYLGRQDVAVVADSPFPFEWWATTFYGFNVLVSLVFIGIGVVIVWRRSDDWMAIVISLLLITVGGVGITPSTEEIIPPGTVLYFFVTLLAFVGYFGPFTALFYFPDGRFVPKWSRWFCGTLIVSLAFLFFVSNYVSTSDFFWFGFGALMGICVLVGVGSMVYRYRRIASPLERQQIKWVALGLLAPSVSVVTWIFFSILLPPEQPNPTRTLIVAFSFPVIVLLNTLFPITVAIAVVRYRLWDVDLIIRRTLIYALLTSILIVMYFLCVIVLQRILAVLTGGERNEIVTVLSTLAIAALFVPLRRRIQAVIDQRFCRQKYDNEILPTNPRSPRRPHSGHHSQDSAQPFAVCAGHGKAIWRPGAIQRA